jgi:DNA helicase II / ATP-dependent DNA helicase PcrA
MSGNSHSNLNAEQEKAVLATEGPVLILAGAGAGKTKTLTERIRHLISQGVAPSSILAITFTNKAAKEMRERVEKELKADQNLNRPVSFNERPFVSTFHSLGVHVLREQSSKIGLKKHFAIFDRSESKRAVKEAMTTRDLDPKIHDPARILSIISKEKGRGITAESYIGQEGGGRLSGVVAEIWLEYERILTKEGALDFDDLLLRTRNLLANDSEVRAYYRSVWQYIHVDEYQDTNRVQYEIARLLAGDGSNICVVGDIDQSIYSWRGADIKNILDFERDYPNAQVFVLEENYRSTKTILEAANVVIEKNHMRRKKNLFTSNSSGEKIGIFSGFDEWSEAEFISTKASELIKRGTPADEIAILYRANFQSRAIEEAFLRHDVPYQLLGTKFFERKEVKDILSYLRAALNPESLSDMKRIINVPTRGIGKTTIAKLFSGMEESLPSATKSKINSFKKLLSDIETESQEKKLSETIIFIIKHSGMEDEWKEGGKDEDAARLENVYELANFATRYDHLPPEDAILAFLSDAALQSDQDEMNEEKKAVRLMTVHASKGLEFETVFITGLEEGLFPHLRMSESQISEEEAEEERRLFYVALTRARKKLLLTYAESRTVFGRRQVNIPSAFIFDIPPELTEEESFGDQGTPRKPLLEIDF